jgi:two-component system chemotaxis sensor kinase CheA
MVEFDRSAFIAKFQEEAQDLLQRLNEGVIALEADPGNREVIDTMLRDAHTLKGSSRMVGLIEVSDVAHWLEDIMVRVRDHQLSYTPQMSEPFFEALDAIVYLTDNAGVNVDGAIDLDTLKARLALIAASGVAAALDEPATDPVQVPSAGPAAEVAPRVAAAVSASERTEPERARRDEELKPKVQNTIRIRTLQVDNLLNVISEVVIAQIKDEQRITDLKAAQASADESWKAWQRIRSMLTTLGGAEIAEALGGDLDDLEAMLADRRRDSSTLVKGYAEDVSRSSVIVNDLQEQGMRLRMLPANTIFQAFPLAVRDLAKQFRKEINLVIQGGDTELDKKVLEEINDPLVHIMRNAVDHGIEDPATRLSLGKPAEGTIVLSARPEGDRILIEITDDGAGIDPDKVRESAVRKGYITEVEAKVMSDREAQYMIFEAGFSTASIITEISGRGVGMDVVREFVVEKLKGSLDLDSQVGRGTIFKLTIPLTLAIIRALMLRVGGQVYALPTASIEETLRVDPSDIMKVEGRDVIRRQRRTVPLVRLSDILGVTPEPTSPKIPIAIIGYSGHRMGFIVDAFVGEQQIVIKALGSHLHKVANVAGVTILGAGEVVPILNVPDLMTHARTRSGQRVGMIQRDEREGPRSVLICEDSFTTRELERSIFEAAGYLVETANDGAQGLAMLKEGLRVDAVVTDVQMPNMTGFQLTRAIKSDPALAETPVIIVTSLERDEEKAEGVDAGADAYITKSVFNQDTLLDTVERLIR